MHEVVCSVRGLMKSLSSLIKSIEPSKESRKQISKCVATLHKVATHEKEQNDERIKSLKIKEYKEK